MRDAGRVLREPPAAGRARALSHGNFSRWKNSAARLEKSAAQVTSAAARFPTVECPGEFTAMGGTLSRPGNRASDLNLAAIPWPLYAWHLIMPLIAQGTAALPGDYVPRMVE